MGENCTNGWRHLKKCGPAENENELGKECRF